MGDLWGEGSDGIGCKEGERNMEGKIGIFYLLEYEVLLPQSLDSDTLLPGDPGHHLDQGVVVDVAIDSLAGLVDLKIDLTPACRSSIHHDAPSVS